MNSAYCYYVSFEGERLNTAKITLGVWKLEAWGLGAYTGVIVYRVFGVFALTMKCNK